MLTAKVIKLSSHPHMSLGKVFLKDADPDVGFRL